jgi:bacterioferritin
MPYFVENIEEIRARARRKIDAGPVTEGYELDKDRAIAILNEALATEIVCVLRYMHHYFMATGVHGRAIADEFKEHADDEREHADKIGQRIQQLGGKPDLNPGTLVERSVAQYVEGETLADMIREDLVAERIVIDVYRDMIRFFGDRDPTSRVLMENILVQEEEHANDLADFLYVVDPRSGETEGVDRGAFAETVTAPGQFQTDAPQAQQPRRRPERQERTVVEARSGEEEPEISSAPEHAIPPAHPPGSTGRPTRKRPPIVEAVAAPEEEQAQVGESRAVRITNPSRKGKKIA